MSERIILDTNIWVSYFIGRNTDEIALTILNHNLTVFSCIELEAEVVDVLSRAKFKKLIRLETDRYLFFLRSLTQSVQINKRVKGCPDDKDDFLFDLGIQTNSAFLVTGDKRLLTFDLSPIAVMPLKAFKETYPPK